ncbi:hypothetical protein [Faecalibaculum rodentium]|uniref:hypothetical protein n=1 Tax=Faecalibaculum rodentium TaxID=1702221 RepID=UPI0023F00BB3|nr:hypothetical protein [Faecalibaculum rodentium]
MYKKTLGALFSVLMLAGCASGTGQPVSTAGTYVMPDGSGDGQEAVIKGKDIEIYWVAKENKTKALYWKGDAPEEAKESGPLKWTSQGDREAMDSSLLASQDSTKEFTLDNGVLSYEASAMGVTKTVELKKEQ